MQITTSNLDLTISLHVGLVFFFCILWSFCRTFKLQFYLLPARKKEVIDSFPSLRVWCLGFSRRIFSRLIFFSKQKCAMHPLTVGF